MRGVWSESPSNTFGFHKYPATGTDGTMSRPPARRRSGYWQNFENVKREIDEFNLAHGSPGTMPKENHLKKMGCGSLANAIHQGFGGFQKLGLRLGYATSRNPNGMFDDFEVLKSALAAWVDAYGMPGMMPTAKQLKASSRNDLVIAITKHDGPQSWRQVRPC